MARKPTGRKKQKPLNQMTPAERRAFMQNQKLTGNRANLRGFTPTTKPPTRLSGSTPAAPANQSWGSKAQMAALKKAQQASAAARRKFKSVTGRTQATYKGR